MLRRSLAVAAAVIGVAGGIGAVSAAHASRPSATVLCDHNQHLLVHSGGGKLYQIRNPYWRGAGPMCIRNRLGGANFRVTRTPSPDPAGRVVGYPDIFRGCIWNVCTPNSNIPIRASKIRRAVSTWHTRERAPGTWNAAYDIWFGKHRMTQGHADGAELMIWLNHHGACCFLPSGTPKVRIGAHLFWLAHWRAYDPDFGLSWNYIQFRMVHPRWKVNGLRIKPFIHRCEQLGLIRPSWWMENLEAGFEIWSGGRGLATTRFNVLVR